MFAARLSRSAARRFSTAPHVYTLPELPYAYSALEPVISGEIMQAHSQFISDKFDCTAVTSKSTSGRPPSPRFSLYFAQIHHAKHHQAYVTNLNAALQQYAEAQQKNDMQKMIALQGAIKFNGGGHVNHSLFWQNLAAPKEGGGEPPTGALADAINAQFGSLDAFVAKFNSQTAAVQGSGWGWLGLNKETGKVAIATTANQDPLSTVGLVPLLGIDVWEHAYYLQHKNVRPDYLKAVWKVVNWAEVGKRFAAAK